MFCRGIPGCWIACTEHQLDHQGKRGSAAQRLQRSRLPLACVRWYGEFGIGPVHTCTLLIPKGASATVDGHVYDRDVMFHYFQGQEAEIQARPGWTLMRDGIAVPAGTYAFPMHDNLRFELVRQ